MNWRYVIFVVLTLALTAGLAVATVQTARLLRVWRPVGNPLLYPSDVALRVILCGVCVFLGVMSGAPFADLGWAPETPWRDAGLGVVVGAALALVFGLLTRRLTARTGERYYSAVVVELIAPRSRREMVLVALALIPAVLLEELLFRSLWIGGFGLVMPALWLVFAGSVIFGAMHMPQGVWGVAGAALAGMLFGALFLWTGSLVAPVVTHYVANVTQLMTIGEERLQQRERGSGG